jgi:adenylate cyclase
MALEIERKFLVDGRRWKPGREGVRMIQSYLEGMGPGRVRVTAESGFITFKGPAQDAEGRVRTEEEFCVPRAMALDLLDQCCLRPFVEKTRHIEIHDGRRWEVDVFHGDNAGLVVAEVELERADEPVRLPEWVCQEVTGDPRYSNFALRGRPWRTWTHDPPPSKDKTASAPAS